MLNRRPATPLVAATVTAGLAAGLLMAAPALADAPDTELHNGYLIRVPDAGPPTERFNAVTYSGAGDVNGDGYDDMLLGTPAAESGSGVRSGAAYVVFGGTAGAVDVTALGSRGFRIDSAGEYTATGSGLAAAGDVNDDGYDDMLIGAQDSANNGREQSGSVYVVFGRPGTGTVDLGNLGGRGLRIDGATAFDRIGAQVNGAGDVNGDGFDDMLLGTVRYATDPAGARHVVGYVVLGGPAATTVDLAGLGNRGFKISDTGASKPYPHSQDAAGDINRDGVDDLVFGSPEMSNNGRAQSGSALVVLGGPVADVDLAHLGDRGFGIDGAQPNHRLGTSVFGTGDINGDRVDDLLLGWTAGYGQSPTAYAIFGGKTKSLDLRNPGDRAVTLAGSPGGPPGDVDGDGVNDLLISDPSGVDDRMVFGSGNLGKRKVRLDGTGWKPAGGDVNGDGHADLIALNNYRSKRLFVTFGGPPTTLKVKARKKAMKIRRVGRTQVVRRITVGGAQKVSTSVAVTPKRARKKVKVKQTARRVVVRTKKTPKKLRKKIRVQVRAASYGPGYLTTTWVRTWRVR